MIGQQKRSLEHTGFSQPVKYQKHLGEDASETHSRIPLMADKGKESQHHISEVSEKSPAPIDTTCDAVIERESDSELRVEIIVNEASEPENGKRWSSAQGFVASEENVRSTLKETRGRGDEELTMQSEESTGLHGKKISRMADARSVDAAVGTNDPVTSKAGAFCGGQHENSGSHPGSTSKDSSLPHLGNDHSGLTRIGGSIGDEDALDVVHEISQNRRRKRTQPVFLSQKVIDLYETDERVQSCGGYDAVTSEGLWGNISETLGLSSDCGPGLKLVYFKHLKDLERGRGHHPDSDCGNGLSRAVNTTAAVLSRDRAHGKDETYSTPVGEQFAESEPVHIRTAEARVNCSSSYDKIDGRRSTHQSEDETEPGRIRSTKEGRDRRFLKGHGDHNVGFARQGRHPEQLIPDRALLEKENKMLVDTLMWIKRMALYPGNPLMGQGLDGTGENENWAQECAAKASEIRSLLWKRRDSVRQGDGNLHQLRQIGAPAHYYEEVPRQEQQVLDRLRVTRERIAHYGSSTVQKPSSESASFHRGSPSIGIPQWVGQSSYRPPRPGSLYSNDERYAEELPDRQRKRIPIGPDFQARIPRCKYPEIPSSVADRERAEADGDDSSVSGEEDEGELKWLGKRVWPPAGADDISNSYVAGRGRHPFCACSDPQSVDCVRLHVLEERRRLQREIGEAFSVWKFDQMGESIVDGWSKAEERLFRALVKANPPSLDKNFWDQLPEAFPGKTHTELVSYYFNVFMLRRRAVQNRLGDDKHVDSDDDELELAEESSNDSDEYESGDDADDETYEDASDDEEDKDDIPFAVDSSARILEGAGVCDLGGGPMIYTSKIGAVSRSQQSEGVPMALRRGHQMGLEGGQPVYRASQREERHVGLRTGHLPEKWLDGHHDDGDEKRLEEEHVSVVGEEELQEVQTWEAPHWDEAPLEESARDQVPKDRAAPKSDRSALCTEGVHCLFKKETDAVGQHTVASCEGEVWGTSMEIAPAKARDKLLSTNGMIQELFGTEASSASLDAST